MAVALRLKRIGNTHRPFYRVSALDSRKKRDGIVLEELGWYNPLEKDAAKQSSLKLDRCKYWIGVGAQPIATVATLFKNHGLNPKHVT